ncbi:MAG: hypothetical protein F4X72_09525 [Dehalococcoidia bacterium]|nr:hypothetical protein [Dehalococcoidia bacterium]
MREQETSVDVEEELRVAVKARQELGIDHEDEVIESFLARVQGTIDARVEARVDEELRGLPTRPRFASPSNGRIKVVIGYTAVCLALSIPIASVVGELAFVAIAGSIVVGGVMLILPEGNAPAELGPGKRERDTNKLR